MKKVIKLIICTVIIMGIGLTSQAASLDNFERTREYSDNFSDVSEADWFYTSVKSSYEMGITDGYGEGEFAPYEPISVAEAIAFGAKISAVYEKSEIRGAAEGEAWYAPYIEYAEEIGIIEAGVFTERDMDNPATRAEVAYILARSVNFTDLKNINTHIDALPDVSAYDEFYNEIIMLYRAGVITGKDSLGRFYPAEYINRSEVAAMISRIADKSLRLEVTFSEPESGRAKYDAVAIADKASSAVFYIEIYDSRGAATKSGSGFFIASDGTAVTNFHVIEGGYSAKVRTTDGSVYEVLSVIGYEKERDIAIIKVAGEGYNYLEFADSDLVAAGESVFCIGSPLGLENTISTGVVSNTDRIDSGLSYIQISAPISSGSSGGVVLDDECRVIGISCGGYTSGQNLNLAIPINAVADVARDKNITLYEMTTGRKPADTSSEAAGLGGVAGQNIGYADNKNIPDFGALNSLEETADAEYSNGIVTRTYQGSVDAVNRYIELLYELDFYRQRSTRFNGNIAMVYVSYDSAVLIEYDMHTEVTEISYYYSQDI